MTGKSPEGEKLKKLLNSLTPETAPIIELLGDIPEPGRQFCAICCMRYLGDINTDPGIIRETHDRVMQAVKDRRSIVTVLLPDLPKRPLRLAITTAITVYVPYPLPVCWVHMQGGIIDLAGNNANDQRG